MTSPISALYRHEESGEHITLTFPPTLFPNEFIFMGFIGGTSLAQFRFVEYQDGAP